MLIQICGRCYAEVTKLFPATCAEKPEILKGVPLGQYHCPDCGAMLIAGYEHPLLCARCIEHKHSDFE